MSPSPRQSGFTLLELTIVMGILSGFLLMLVQFVDSGVQLFDEGERGQALADRAEAARVAVERELRALEGSGAGIAPGVPHDRLLAQWLPIGLPARSLGTDPRGVVLRAAVQLEPEVEQRLIEEDALMQAAMDLGPNPDPRAVAERAQQRIHDVPLRGQGRILLAMWPKDDDAALLELRIARFLPDQLLAVPPDRTVDPFLVPVPGGADLPAVLLHEISDLLVDDLLHFELQFWSQTTQSWDAQGAAGPELVWDSARAGWLADTAIPPVFRLDRGPESLEDPTDDVHPRAVRVVLVTAVGPNEPPEGMLAETLGPGDRTLRLANGERFPGAADGGFVKVRGEWIRYGARSGDELTGLARGQRGTKAVAHPTSALVRVGRTVDFTILLPNAKDDWNG